jgi:hypothetical protein
MENKTICSVCETHIEEHEYHYNNLKTGEPVCEGCVDHSYNYPMLTSTTYLEGEVERVMYNDTLGAFVDQYFDMSEESPQNSPVESAQWVSTSAWRGYMGFDLKPSWVTLESGWATGRHDDVKWKHAFNDFIDELEEGNLYTHFPVVVVSAPTSNVFSTAIDVCVRERDVDAFWEAVGEHCGLTAEALKTSLS